MTTFITPLVRAWLNDGPAGDATAGRISTIFEPMDGVPAIHIGAVNGGPGYNASTNLDVIEAWQVALYIHGGRLNDGLNDLPDDQATWSVVDAIASSCRELDAQHYLHADGARIVAARVVSLAPGVDPDTGEARATMTLAVSVWQ
jgi:hypothetical protein